MMTLTEAMRAAGFTVESMDGDYSLDGVKLRVTLHPDDYGRWKPRWKLHTVWTPHQQRRKGKATEALRKLQRAADDAGVVLVLHAEAFDDTGPATRTLERWYHRLGFVKRGSMFYYPG